MDRALLLANWNSMRLKAGPVRAGALLSSLMNLPKEDRKGRVPDQFHRLTFPALAGKGRIKPEKGVISDFNERDSYIPALTAARTRHGSLCNQNADGRQAVSQ